MFRSFKDFCDRRIKIPVDWEGLVLDVGSGDKPHWRADILCDLYPEDTYAHHRSGGGKAKVSAPLVVGDVQNLPFKDKAFDFVVCSHVLTHVPDIDKACKELMRVGKSGYIELPAEGHAKINDFESHLWWCHKNGRTLTFTPKESMQFDKEIYKFSQTLIKRKVWFEKVIHPNFDLVTVQIWWHDSFDYKVKGPVSETLLEEIREFELHHHHPARNKESLLLKIFRTFLKLFMWHKTRKDGFYLESLLRCPESKEENIKKISDHKYVGAESGERIKVLSR